MFKTVGRYEQGQIPATTKSRRNFVFNQRKHGFEINKWRNSGETKFKKIIQTFINTGWLESLTANESVTKSISMLTDTSL